MGTDISTILMAICILIQGLLIDYRCDNDMAFAGDPSRETSPVVADCDVPITTAFVPSLDYTYTFSSPQRAGSITCSPGVTLNYGVNGDTTPSVACSVTDELGYAVINNVTPVMKLGGIQCDGSDRVIMEVNGDGADNPKLDIAISSPSTNSWQGADKVDDSTSASKVVIYGAGGQVGGDPLIDGDDYDGYTNGEVAFGGAITSTGGSRMFIRSDFTNSAVSEEEVLTFTFTATQ